MPFDDGVVSMYARAHNFQSVRDLEEAVGFDRTHISRVIRGERRSPELIRALGQATRRSPATVTKHISALRNGKTSQFKTKYKQETTP